MNPTSNGATAQNALKAITLQNLVKSPLLCLPAEIRNQIYGYTLKDTFKLCAGRSCAPGRVRNITQGSGHVHYPRHLLNLLEVCKQTHAEASLLFFRINPLNGGHEAIDRFLWGAEQHVFTLDQKMNLRVIKLGISDYHMAYGSNGTIIGVGGIIKGTMERLKQLSELKTLFVIIRRQIRNRDSHALPKKSVALIRRQVENMVKRKGKTIEIKIWEHRTVARSR